METAIVGGVVKRDARDRLRREESEQRRDLRGDRLREVDVIENECGQTVSPVGEKEDDIRRYPSYRSSKLLAAQYPDITLVEFHIAPTLSHLETKEMRLTTRTRRCSADCNKDYKIAQRLHARLISQQLVGTGRVAWPVCYFEAIHGRLKC